MSDVYILTIVPEKELDSYVTNANKWEMEKVHTEVANKAKMPCYLRDGQKFFISCMPVTYFKGRLVADAWTTAEAVKSKAQLIKTENPSEWLSKNGYKAPEIETIK